MDITLHHSPILKLKDVENGGQLEVSVGSTIETLLSSLGIPEDQHRYLLAYANREKKELSYVIQNGDVLHLYLPIGGG